MLVDGKWIENWQPVQASDDKGRFIRQTSTFRNWVTVDGGEGPEGQLSFPAEEGRYHLIVAYICPWACRTLMVRALKGLEDVISVSVVDPRLTDQGWKFGDFPGSTPVDELIDAKYAHNLYTHVDPQFTGRATVPILWDKKTGTIVNNESADIIRILNSGFETFAKSKINLRPVELIEEIDTLNERLYNALNNGVYRAGFASSQIAYEEAYADIFAILDDLEEMLSDGRQYLLGERLTECDIRAFVTLIRFDAAYVGLFKTNRHRIAEFFNLSAFTKRILEIPRVFETVRIDHIKAGYYSVKALNPSGIIPTGPDLSELGL